MPMFFCAAMGNTTYALSLLLSDAAIQGGHTFWISSLPFLLGSAGTLIFDFIIFCQSFMYSEQNFISLDCDSSSYSFIEQEEEEIIIE